jgi:hypothetical protein
MHRVKNVQARPAECRSDGSATQQPLNSSQTLVTPKTKKGLPRNPFSFEVPSGFEPL